MKKNLIGLCIIVIITLVAFIYVKTKYNQKNKKDEPKKITELTRLDFGYTTGTYIYGNISYEINCEDKCILSIKPDTIPDEEKQEVEIDKKTINKVIDILNKYEVTKWDGWKKSDPNVLDGSDFHMYLTIQDNKTISASGYMMFPKNYGKVQDELDKLLGSYYKK